MKHSANWVLIVFLVCFNFSMASCNVETPGATEMVASPPHNPTASVTPSETVTQKPKHTPTQTSPPSPVATISPTPDKAFQVILSPLGEWVAKIYYPDDRQNPGFTTKISESNGQTDWELFYPTEQSAAEAYYVPFYWTSDDHYLYLSVHRAMDGCGKLLEFYNGSGLFRLDLRSGEVTEIVPEGKLASYAFSISPEETFLIYAQEAQNPVTLQVKNIFDGQEKTILLDEKYDGVGHFFWSPHSNAIIFVAMQGACEKTRRFSLEYLDLNSLETVTLIDTLDSNLVVIKWETPDILVLGDEQGNAWELDLSLSELMLTPWETPIP